MTIQSSHYHRLITYTLQQNLLPISLSKTFSTQQKRLEFYSYGFVKEKISHKIVSSFEICDPNFFTTLRDAIWKMRSVVYDELFSGYIPDPICDKSKFVCMILTESYLQIKTLHNNQTGTVVLMSLFNFILNCLFLAGCDLYFQSPQQFKMTEPDRDFLRRRNMSHSSHWNISLADLFDLSDEECY
ncbi:hypothetical protein QTN25_002973 [Entamoeba marina]